MALNIFFECLMSNIEALLFKTFTKQRRRTADFAIKEAVIAALSFKLTCKESMYFRRQ